MISRAHRRLWGRVDVRRASRRVRNLLTCLVAVGLWWAGTLPAWPADQPAADPAVPPPPTSCAIARRFPSLLLKEKREGTYFTGMPLHRRDARERRRVRRDPHSGSTTAPRTARSSRTSRTGRRSTPSLTFGTKGRQEYHPGVRSALHRRLRVARARHRRLLRVRVRKLLRRRRGDARRGCDFPGLPGETYRERRTTTSTRSHENREWPELVAVQLLRSTADRMFSVNVEHDFLGGLLRPLLGLPDLPRGRPGLHRRRSRAGRSIRKPSCGSRLPGPGRSRASTAAG
ncbi:MAG: hypothetical protein MZV49_00295 [Rhodopseudomonas palustris]|nr:hypothetical protein [Rhodopseudomonas palustris]